MSKVLPKDESLFGISKANFLKSKVFANPDSKFVKADVGLVFQKKSWGPVGDPPGVSYRKLLY